MTEVGCSIPGTSDGPYRTLKEEVRTTTFYPMLARNPRELGSQSLAIKDIISSIIAIPILIVGIIVARYFLPITERGFFCNDVTIRYPLLPETIRWTTLVYILISIFFIIMTVTELYRAIRLFKFTNPDAISRYIITSFLFFTVYFCFGFLVNLLIVTITKKVVGRLRPYFLSVCNPNLNFEKCITNLEYISSYKCSSNTSIDYIQEARMSFYSGHASAAVYVVIFCMLYINARISLTNLLIPFVHVALAIFGLWVGQTRVIDRRHHVTDVLTGNLFGLLIGLFAGYYVAQFRSETSFIDENDEKLPLTTRRLKTEQVLSTSKVPTVLVTDQLLRPVQLATGQ